LPVHNTATGTVELLQMNGASISAIHDYFYPVSWQPVSAQADFNEDDKSDVLMRSASGTLQVLQMDGVNNTGTQDIAYTADWQPVVGP
jgi:hypothetical protein